MTRGQPHSSVADRRNFLAVLVVVTGGLLLTSAVFWKEREVELDLFRARLASDSAARAELVKHRLDECLLITTALDQFLRVAEPVGRQEFSAFTSAFPAAETGLKAIEWIPLVPRSGRPHFEEEGRLAFGPDFRFNERDANGRSVAAGERDLYYPVFYVEPLKGNEPAAGFDLGSNPTRLAALERARDTGQAAATGRINLVQEKGGVYGFLVFVPVYRRGTQPATVEQRRSTLQGFALAVFNSDLLMRPLLRAREAIGLDFDLLDLSGSEAERLLYRWVSPLLGGSSWESQLIPVRPNLEYEFSFAGRQWGLQFTPNRAYLERDYPLAYWFLLPGGFLITIVLALYLHTVLSQSSRLEREVSERTAKLLESERRMASVLANVQDAYFRADLEGRLVIVSPSGARMYGYASPEEMIGLSARDLYADAAERKSVREELRRLGRVDDRVGRAARRDGRELYVSLNTQFCFDEHGAIAGTEGFVRDVTERRRTENVKAAIYEISEAAQQAPSLDDLFAAVHRIVGRLMEARNFYVALYDATTNLLSFPYFVDEVDERPDPFPADRGVTSHVVHSGQPLLATQEVLRDFERRGEIKPLGAAFVDWLGVPLRVQGRVIGVLAVQSYSGKVRYSEADKEALSYVSAQVAQAIERKRAEDALRESEARFRQSIEAFSDGFVLIDEQGAVIEWNAALERINGITRAEALGKPLWDVQFRVYLPERRTPERYDFLKRSVQDAVRTGRLPSPPDQIDIWSLDGRRRTVSQSVFGIKTQKGLRIGILLRDITDLIELEGQLRQAQKMEAVGSLAGGVAHDFNNILQALLAHAQLIRSKSEGQTGTASSIQEMEDLITRGASLTRQLLLFSRRETSKPESLDLNDAVTDAARMLRRLVRANIALEIKLTPEPLPVIADRGQLDQVLMNLVVNASDAMSEGGTLTIRTGALDASRVWLSVADTGVGVSEAIRDRIFEPFFTTKERGKGTGLGLSVVHGTVARHGGTIEVESEFGRGSTFRVILPRTGSGGFAAVTEALKAAADLEAGHGERILVVEDEDAAREGLRDILRSLGYEVIAACSGEEAGELPAEPPCDVLLTDLMLPGISGTQLAAGLRERWPSLRVILMSGYTEDEAVRRGVGEGKVRFLQKPFDMARLAREIRGALSDAPRGGP